MTNPATAQHCKKLPDASRGTLLVQFEAILSSAVAGLCTINFFLQFLFHFKMFISLGAIRDLKCDHSATKDFVSVRTSNEKMPTKLGQSGDEGLQRDHLP